MPRPFKAAEVCLITFPAGVTTVALLLGANPYLEEGRAHFEAVRYQAAEARLRLACQVPTSTREERREAFDLLARALLAQGRQEEAELAYAQLLTADPAAPAPSEAAPKVKAAFQRAKAQVYPPGFVGLTALPSPEGQLRVSVVDPWLLVEALVLVEAGRDGALKESELAVREGKAAALLPTAQPEGEARWHVEARDRAAKVVGRLEPAAAPRVLPPPPALASQAPPPSAPAVARPPRPRWVPVVAAVAVVAVAATGAALAVSAEDDYARAGAAPDALSTRRLDARYRQKGTAAGVLLGGAALGAVGVGILLWTW